MTKNKLDVDIARLDAAIEALEARARAEDTEYEDARRLMEDAFETRLFTAVAIGAARRVDRIAWVAEQLARVADADPTPPHDEPMVAALGALLGRLPPDDARWKRYGSSRDARLREAVATAADPSTAAGAALIEALRKDKAESVRAIARKRPLDRPVDWWSAAFSFDPWTVIPRESRGELEAPLRRVVEAAEKSAQRTKDEDGEVGRALIALPTALARDAWARFIESRSYGLGWLRPVLVHLLCEPGGVDWAWPILLRVLERISDLELEETVVEIPEDRRAGVLLELAGRALTPRKRGEPDPDYLNMMVVSAIGDGWLDADDPLALLPLLERADPEASNTQMVARILAQPAHAARVVPRLLEEQARGEGLFLRLLEGRVARVIAAAPAELVRPWARAALDSGDERRRAWAVDECLGRCHDAQLDPPREVLAAELAGRPATRASVLERHSGLVIDGLRAKLRAEGTLALDEARAVVNARVGDPPLRLRLQVGEWAKLRRVRHSALDAGDTAGLAALFPRDQWSRKDWADFDALVARDGEEAAHTLPSLERQTAPRAAAALEALAESNHEARQALARWRAFHD